MYKAIFFGDSLTSGQNNNDCSYVDYINYPGIKLNYGVSGTTFGSYSIYPVGDHSLIDKLLQNRSNLQDATDVFIEYGINDAVSVACEYTTLRHVIIDVIKCIDLVKQVAPFATIHFILLTYEAIGIMSKLQANYLISDYLSPIYSRSVFSYRKDEISARLRSSIASTYAEIAHSIISRDDVELHYAIDSSAFSDNVDSDNLHPNDEGYRVIAEKIGSIR